jgi:two-component system, NarL family, nitrate/nitrite response regulator NarL
MIRVFIVARIKLYREGIAQLLGRRSGMTVVGVKSDLQEAAADIQGLQPDVVVLDMTTAGSHATVRDLKRLAPGMAVVALGVGELEGDILACVEAGVAGYVTREGSFEDLVTVVESAVRGELRCSPEVAGSLVRRLAALAADREASPSQARLTTRECEIVRLLEQGLSNKEIAVHLGIEVATVKNHVHNLLEKLKVHRRTEAARLFRHRPSWTRGTAMVLSIWVGLSHSFGEIALDFDVMTICSFLLGD